MTMTANPLALKYRLSDWIEANAALLCIGVTCIGALLRLYNLGTRSLWMDEAIEILIARAPLSGIPAMSVEMFSADPPFLSWLLHLALKVGSSEAIVRLPPLLFGTLAVYASYHLFRLWVDVPTALIAQVCFALAPAQVYYSQEANQYALIVTFSILILWAFEKAVRQTDWRRMVVFGAFSIFGILTSYALIWLLLGLAITLLFRQRPRKWLHWWPAIVMIGTAGIILFLSVTLPQLQRIEAVFPSSVSELNDAFSPAELIANGIVLLHTVRLFTDLTGGYLGELSVLTWFFILLFLTGTGVSLYKREWRPLVAVLLLCVLLTYIPSKLGVYFWGMRYLLFISPLFYLILGIGLGVLRRHPLGNVIPGIAIVILAFNQLYPGWVNGQTTENLRPVMQWVQSHTEAEDGIYVYYGARPAFLVYYQSSMDNVKIGTWFRDEPLPVQMSDIDPFLAVHPRSWFIASHINGNEVNAILSTLDQRCRRTSSIVESGALAERYDCTGKAD